MTGKEKATHSTDKSDYLCMAHYRDKIDSWHHPIWVVRVG